MNRVFFTKFVSKCLVNVPTLIASYFSKMETQAKTVKQLGNSWSHMELSRLAFLPEVQTSIPKNIFLVLYQKNRSRMQKKKMSHTKHLNSFSERITTTITSYSVREIDKIIENMHKRMKMIVKNKGERLKH